jgi:uncharacterized spore protein YtfJ
MTVDEAMTTARKAAGADTLLERIVERLGGRAGIEAVFGEPIRSGDRTVVPVGRVRWAGGVGSGASETDGTSGSGGGGGVAVDPIGYLEITPEAAQFRPINVPYPSAGFLVAAAVAAAIVLRALARLRG